MNTPILSTKDTNKASKLSAIISGIADVVFAVILFGFIKAQADLVPLENLAGYIIVGVIALAVMAVYTVCQFAICNSYVDVYADQLKGKGIQNGYQVVDFCLSYDKITNVTYAGIYIHIQTVGGKYKVLTNAETAKKVYEYCAQVLA